MEKVIKEQNRESLCTRLFLRMAFHSSEGIGRVEKVIDELSEPEKLIKRNIKI
jgi:hypothetical protein